CGYILTGIRLFDLVHILSLLAPSFLFIVHNLGSMKRSILLFGLFLLAVVAHAQNAQKSILSTDFRKLNNYAHPTEMRSLQAGARTTLGGARWYSYGDSIQGYAERGSDSFGYLGVMIWNDMTSIVGYTGSVASYEKDSFTSVGLSFN